MGTKDELDKVNEYVDKMTSEIAQLKEKQQNHEEQDFKSKITELETQNTNLETMIKEQQIEYENKVQSLTEDKEALVEKVALLEQDPDKISALQERIVQLEQDADKVNVQLEEETVEKNELEEKMVKDQ